MKTDTMKLRLIYAFFGGGLAAEVCIALFVHDAFIRPYGGDILVTVVLCFLCEHWILKNNNYNSFL